MSRKKREQKKTKRVPAKKREVRIKTQEDRLLWKLIGVALIAFAVFFRKLYEQAILAKGGMETI